MLADPSLVIVSSEPCSCSSIHTACAHHRDLPELRAEGDSPQDAVARLAEQLSQALENSASQWRRETLEKAIEDDDVRLPPSSLYAYAALSQGIPYVNFTPSTGASLPAIIELARRNGLPVAVHPGAEGRAISGQPTASITSPNSAGSGRAVCTQRPPPSPRRSSRWRSAGRSTT